MPTASPSWCEVKDGNEWLAELHRRHYSCRYPERKMMGGNYSRCAGNGAHICLVSTDGRAAFIWRRVPGEGVLCSLFRNEGPILSSDLIREAVALAWRRWPGERLYTYVNSRAVRGDGACFKHAGWTKLKRRTVCRGLVILELTPQQPDKPGRDPREENPR